MILDRTVDTFQALAKSHAAKSFLAIMLVLAFRSGASLRAQEAANEGSKNARQTTVQALSVEVLKHVRQRDLDSAATALAAIADRPLNLSDITYSPLPAAAGGFARMHLQQSVGEQYDRLESWTLPSEERNHVRLLSTPVPTVAPPKVFARSLRERPRDSTFAVASVGPVPGLFCSGWAFVQAADELGRLARLRTTLEQAAENKVSGAERLLMLSYLAGSRGNLDRVNAYLESMTESDPDKEISVGELHDLAIAAAASLHPETQAASESFLQSLVQRSGTDHSIGLRPFVRIAHAMSVQAAHGESPPASLFNHRLRHWINASVTMAKSIERGQPETIWLSHQRNLLHLAGAGTDVLLFRYPVTGDFDFICETQEGSDIGTDGGLAYGGLQFQALGRTDQLTVWDADAMRSVTLVSTFARSDTRPVFNRVSIRSREASSQFESNFHPVWFDGDEVLASPWIGLRSAGTKRPVFRHLQFTGDPEIPRQVNLIAGTQLRGWQSSFFGETKPDFQGVSDRDEQSFDWRVSANQIVAASQAGDAGQQPGLLRYHRPLLDGESLRYEFFVGDDTATVHPAVGRLAFLLESTGVRVRWITTGDTEWTGLERDNAALEPLNRRGPRPLPLRDNDWNSVDVSLQNDSVQITLNDQVIYQRPLEGNSDTQIGLYRSSRASESRIRNATLTGDWPSVLPNDLLETTD